MKRLAIFLGITFLVITPALFQGKKVLAENGTDKDSGAQMQNGIKGQENEQGNNFNFKVNIKESSDNHGQIEEQKENEEAQEHENEDENANITPIPSTTPSVTPSITTTPTTSITTTKTPTVTPTTTPQVTPTGATLGAQISEEAKGRNEFTLSQFLNFIQNILSTFKNSFGVNNSI